MLWGGLRCIRSRFLLDTFALTSFTICSISSIDTTPTTSNIRNNALFLTFTCILTLLTVGDCWTNRWTITFPAVPIVVLQIIRRYESCVDFGETVVVILSLLLIVLSAVLTIAFPAVEIPPPTGRYNVGVIDLHLPVKGFDGQFPNPSSSSEKKTTQTTDNTKKEGFVSVRILYPTHESVKHSIPYFNAELAGIICAQFMKTAAPPPLKNLTWFVNHWKFARLRAVRNAKPVDFIRDDDDTTNNSTTTSSPSSPKQKQKKIPIVAFSHGILGNASIYSYQTTNLASHGSLVFLLNHTDGSAVYSTRHDQSPVFFRPKTPDATPIEVVRQWRDMGTYRADELLAAIHAVRALNTTNIPQLEEIGLSFVNRLDIDRGMVIAGHSFGAATAIEVAARVPALFCKGGGGLVAYDPALDWAPDFGRRALFERKRVVAAAGVGYAGGTGGYACGGGDRTVVTDGTDDDRTNNNDGETKEEEGKVEVEGSTSSSLHDIDMLFLYSYEFVRKGWGEYPLIKTMHSTGQLGSRKNRRRGSDGAGVSYSNVGYIHQSQHTEFSDTSMMTPLWMARAIGLTGKRNPIDTAEEIACRTLEFYNDITHHKNE